METVDWEMEDNDSAASPISFGENQVGSVTLTLEPVHTGSPLGWVADQFKDKPNLLALPVEKDGGVVGLIARAKVLDRSSRFLEALSARPLDQDLSPHRTLDARESVDKVVASLFAEESQPLVELFLVYLNGHYFGVTDLRRLVSRSALLREQDLSKAQEVQEGALARSRLPATRWQTARLVRMAYGVGGDFYQELAWADGTCLLGCFDVSGKGISGSLVTSALGGFFSAQRPDETPVPTVQQFAVRLNAFLQEILPLGSFVTGTLLVLPAQSDPQTVIKVLNFGYGTIYYYSRSENRVTGRGLRPNLPPLGLDDLVLDESSAFPLPFSAGTKVYVFSDGMPDLMNPSGQRYGEDQLREFLSRLYKHGASEFVGLVKSEIEGWQGTAPQPDDITAVTIQA